MCRRCMPELQRRWEGKVGGKDVRNTGQGMSKCVSVTDVHAGVCVCACVCICVCWCVHN